MMYKVLISDGFCTWEYSFIDEIDGGYCIEDIANCIKTNLKMKEISEHKLVKPNKSIFKYNIGQLVHYLENNKHHSAQVISRICVNNKPDINPCTTAQCDLYESFGKEKIMYSTTHGQYNESQLFATKEDMLKSI